MSLDRVRVTTKQGKVLEVLFRQLMAPLPEGWGEGTHWALEAYDTADDLPPIGYCWVMDYSTNMVQELRVYGCPAVVEYVRVFHNFERQGIATALLDAARQKWPNLSLSAVTEEGEKLLDFYLRRAEKEGVESQEFVSLNRGGGMRPTPHMKTKPLD